MPGGEGSIAEAMLAKTRYKKRVIAFDPRPAIPSQVKPTKAGLSVRMKAWLGKKAAQGNLASAKDSFDDWRKAVNGLDIKVVQTVTQVREWLALHKPAT
jgi:hypothetical protein